MVKIMEMIVYSVRFLVEMVTIFSLIGGGIIVGERYEKILYPMLGVLIVIFWGLFVAPKASYPSGPVIKLIVELLAFTAGTIGVWQLFGKQWGSIYAAVAFIDLALVYLLLFITEKSII